ncbi:hypothetical protein PENSPDRAFT_67793 [Peniophora sp. CONT]|nr:hypothetical protein PENSPDRAFT_67793 [Peniophora sp. CONT]
MSLPTLNTTQEAQILEVLFKSTATSVVPLLLLESLILGVLCACVPLGSYLLWFKSHSFSRTSFISVPWIIFVALITHWALSLRQVESILSGRPLDISLSDKTVWLAVKDSYDLGSIGEHYEAYGGAWQFLLPLVTETALFGFASVLYVIMAATILRRPCFQWRSSFALLIPTTASIMYTLSLTHWAISLRYFTKMANLAPTGQPFPDDHPLDTAFIALLLLNAVMSDSIVLWRMCAVWKNARPILIFGTVLLVTTTALNITNGIVLVVGTADRAGSGIILNSKDSELLFTYGSNSIGLAAAFMSLISNLCATALVGLKAWLHRQRRSMHPCASSHRTLAERFLGFLVDSGVVYTGIWLLYCISFFRGISTRAVLGPSQDLNDFRVVTIVDQLDAAMAQITTIYPLIVFILVALDKVHHSRTPKMPRNDERPQQRNFAEAVTVTFEIDIERSKMPAPCSACPMEDVCQDCPGEEVKRLGSENA